MEPHEWDLLDETARNIIEHVVDDEDQGTSKEWHQYGRYRYPAMEDISKQVKEKLYGCPPWFPFNEVMIKCRLMSLSSFSHLF